jgi:hypothetical protein
MSSLADRIQVLRDEVLDTAERGDRDPPGVEVFDALLRAIALTDTGSPDMLDLTLHDAVARRLAWGDTEEKVLADAGDVFDRLIVASARALRDPNDQIAVTEVAGEVLTALSRIVALSTVGRATRDRTARTREELAQRRLREALAEQKATLARLKQEMTDAGT